MKWTVLLLQTLCFRSSMSGRRAAAAFYPQIMQSTGFEAILLGATGLVKWKPVSPNSRRLIVSQARCASGALSCWRSRTRQRSWKSPEISRMTDSSGSVCSNVTVIYAINLHPMIDNHQVRFAELGQVHVYYQWLWKSIMSTAEVSQSSVVTWCFR